MLEQLPLRDIHLPEPVSWWPPAPGWWLLGAGALLAILLARRGYRLVKKARRRARLRREALGALDGIEHRFAADRDPAAALQAVSVLLRRVARTVFGDGAPVHLSGEEWVCWLRRHAPPGMDTGSLAPLADAPYRARPEADPWAVIRAGRHWARAASRRLEAAP